MRRRRARGTLSEVRPRGQRAVDGLEEGVVFEVPRSLARRPRWRVEYAERRARPDERFIGLRLVVDGAPRLWVDVDDWWESVRIAWAPEAAPSPLPAIRWSELAPRSMEAWGWWWLARLMAAHVEGAATPLHEGSWWCGPVRGARLRPELAPSLLPATQLGSFEGCLIPTRPLSPSGASRVKAWRKQARGGVLPPILAVYSSVSESWWILDGHDRLVAALEAGEVPEVVGLAHLRAAASWLTPEIEAQAQAAVLERMAKVDWSRASEGVIDHFNRSLLQVYVGAEELYCQSRVWPLPGGVAQWGAEVAAVASGLDGPPAEVANEMLWAIRG